MRKAFSLRQAWVRRVRGRATGPRTLGVAVCLLLTAASFARTRAKAAPSFTIDVDQPFSRVVAVVEEVARSGVIHGTFEYAEEAQLEGAEFAAESRLFPAWSGGGKVFYKLRGRTLAPKHFLESNDVGTVGVRYVVEEAGANATRLVIDAVFVENGRHHEHPSDGYVETCEFGEIGKRLKESDQQRTLEASGHEFSPSRESSSQPDDRAATVADLSAPADIRRAIAEQESQLAAETANLRQLEARARRMRAEEFVPIEAERVELKASPYAHARVLTALKRGQEVTVLERSSYWCRVRSEGGEEGWVPNTSLEEQR